MSIALSPPELIMMLMLWLPMQPAGQPAPAQTVFRYVPAQANATVTLDAGSLTASALRGFRDLGKQTFVKGTPALAQRYAQMEQMLARGLKMVQLFGGVDPFKDLRWVTLSLAVGQPGRPDFVVATAGQLQAALAERIATAMRAGAAEALPNGTLYVSTRGSQPSVAWTKDDVLLIGTESLLRTLLKRQPRPTKLARLAQSQHDGQSYCTVAVHLDRKRSKAILPHLPPMFRTLGNSFEGMVLSLRYDGLKLGLAATNGRVLQRYRTLLDGAGSYLIAAEHVARGSLKIGDGLLSPQDARYLPIGLLRAFASNKRELLRYLRRYVPLKTTPSHSTRIDAKRRMAILTYRGSRYTGLVPLFGSIGLLASAKMQMQRRAQRIPPPPPTAQP